MSSENIVFKALFMKKRKVILAIMTGIASTGSVAPFEGKFIGIGI